MCPPGQDIYSRPITVGDGLPVPQRDDCECAETDASSPHFTAGTENPSPTRNIENTEAPSDHSVVETSRTTARVAPTDSIETKKNPDDRRIVRVGNAFYLFFSRSRISVSRTSSAEGAGGSATAAASSSFFWPISVSLVMNLTNRKTTKARMKKLMTAEMKLP